MTVIGLTKLYCSGIAELFCVLFSLWESRSLSCGVRQCGLYSFVYHITAWPSPAATASDPPASRRMQSNDRYRIDEVVLFWHWRIVLCFILPLGESESKLRRAAMRALFVCVTYHGLALPSRYGV